MNSRLKPNFNQGSISSPQSNLASEDHPCFTNEGLAVHAKAGRTGQPHTLSIRHMELAFNVAVL